MEWYTPPLFPPPGKFEFTGVKILIAVFLNKEICYIRINISSNVNKIKKPDRWEMQ